MGEYVINRPEADQEAGRPLMAPSNSWTPGSGLVRWPPPEERARLRAYTTYADLYRGEHETVYVRRGGYTYDWTRPYVTVNLCGEITDLMVDRLFGEMPRITAGGREKGTAEGETANGTADGTGGNGVPPLQATASGRTTNGVDDWIDELVTRSGLHSRLIRVATGTSYRGDGALKVRWTKERGVTITSVSPQFLFLETDADDTETIAQATIGYVRWGQVETSTAAGRMPAPRRAGETGTAQTKRQGYLFLEIHVPGQIAYELYRLRGTAYSGEYSYHPTQDRVPLATLPDLANWPEIQPTGIDQLLIVPIALGADDEGDVYGRSDYADIEGLQGELNNRVTQRAEVLDKHADPWMFGPPSVPDADGNIEQHDRYIQLMKGESAPGYLIWDGSLQAVREEIQDLVQEIVLTAGLSPESFQLVEGGAESGRALKLRQFRTASAVQMRQIVYGEALQKTVSVASKLAVAKGETGASSLEPEDVLIVWQDSLPQDRFEEVQTASIEVDSGLASRRTSIRRLHPEMTDAEIEEELARIEEEAAAARPAVPALGLTDRIKPGPQPGQPASSAISNADRENVAAQREGTTTVGNPEAAG